MLRWFFINFLTILIIAKILPGFSVDNWTNAIFAVFILGLVNVTIKPILHALTFPITFITLGLFALVINTVTLQIAAYFTPGFKIDGFWTAFVASILISLVSSAIESLTKKYQT